MEKGENIELRSSIIRVLLIEDDEIDRKSVERELSSNFSSSGGRSASQYDVITAPDFERASPHLEKGKIDITLLDLSLPDAFGLDALQKVQKINVEVPVVVLTGLDDEEVAIEALKEGAQDYLVKGKHQHILRRSIDYALQRKQTLARLQQAEQDAKEANRVKSEFLANMSHEARTPLTSILGWSDILVNDSLPEDQMKEALSSISRNAWHLLNIINDILDFSKIEAGKILIDKCNFSPFLILAELYAALRIRAEDRGIDFQYEYEYPLPKMIYSDPTRVRQILYNLLQNAIKFTEEGGVRVAVSCNREKEEMKFQVIDTGIGISSEAIQKLFQPFVQADASTTRKYGGSGLGLVISKHLVERLNGKISLESEEGKGSIFTVVISTGSLEEQEFINSVEENRFQIEQPKSFEKFRVKGQILVAEDNQANRELLGHLLGDLDLEIVMVENGKQAIDHALNSHFDMLLLDMQMPVLDGYTAVKILREKNYQQPIVALTANALAGSREQCLDIGCNEYLSKPFKRSELHEVILRYLEQK